uniref:Macaca fascicularis brain cDNA clone: QflA-20080, similar to human solute carrier family 22 (organic cation transporter),member 15 (SLC22A15), mRNA, RefSeq: NM_018420.1 n=1 Tax=Macaca fascicularis TaxID=9541 RepID=I7G4B0_MACFA|nr:unnamed protein product [Macaca fascicularis]
MSFMPLVINWALHKQRPSLLLFIFLCCAQNIGLDTVRPSKYYCF